MLVHIYFILKDVLLFWGEKGLEKKRRKDRGQKGNSAQSHQSDERRREINRGAGLQEGLQTRGIRARVIFIVVRRHI
jgi:hypothetical protein